jgi:hypothetical protein
MTVYVGVGLIMEGCDYDGYLMMFADRQSCSMTTGGPAPVLQAGFFPCPALAGRR